TPRRALLSLLWNRAILWLGSLRWTERRESALSRQALIRVDVYKAVSHGLAMVDNIRGADFQARGIRQALRTGEPMRVGRALALEAAFVGSQGGRGLKQAARLLDRIRRIAEGEGSPYLAAWLPMVEAFNHYFSGRFRSTHALFTDAEARFREQTTNTSW